MSTAALIAAAGMLGLAGAAHCTAMCAAPCAAVCSRSQANAVTRWAFQFARVIGYAAAGAVVGAGASALTAWGAGLSRGLQPLWLLVHLVVFWCGLWLLVRGRQPEWFERVMRPAAGAREHGVALPMPRRTQIGPHATAVVAGLSWVAWPCGLLQAALLMAALADDGFGGAGVMAVFALASSPGLVAAPWIWRRLRGLGGGDNPTGPSIAWALRGSGALLAGASLWALAHDSYVRALCGV